MLDLLYVALTLAFFAAMLAYVAGCARLGRSDSAADGAAEGRARA